MEETSYVVAFDANNVGVTRKSLKMLRDALVNFFAHRIVVVEVPTSDIRCGYFIFDLDLQKATWTGDAFSNDRSSESGAGYVSAEALLMLFGIKPVKWKMLNMDDVYLFPERKAREILLGFVQEIAKGIHDSEFSRPIDKDPIYLI